jgi:hypothetical protein
MKRGIRIILTMLLVHTMMMKGNARPPPSEPPADFPKKVSEILTNSCYHCHTTEAEAKKPKEAMDFNKWEDYSLTKKISLLTKICEVAEKEEMPPEKYLKQHPEKALSASDVITICNWTKKESENLIKQ